MNRKQEALLSVLGCAIGLTLAGIPMGIYAARKWRCEEPADTTSPQVIATSISNVKGAKR